MRQNSGNSKDDLVEKYVGSAYDNVKKVADNIAAVDTLADPANLANIENVIDDVSNINIVANSQDKVDSVADNINNINTVVEDLDNIATTADNLTNINEVAALSDNIEAVVENTTNIDLMVDNLGAVTSVSDSLTAVNFVAENTDLINIAINGWNIIGTFGEVVTVTKRNELVQESDGTTYRYIGTLPFTTTAASTSTSNPNWALINVSAGRRINIADQVGSNTNLKFIQALSIALPGDTVIGHSLLVANPVTSYKIPTGVTVEGGGMIIRPLINITNVIKYEDNGRDQKVVDTIIDANSNNLGAAISGKGNINAVFNNNELYNYTKTGIDFRSYMENGSIVPSANDKSLVNPCVSNNYLHTPAPGVGHPILVTTGIGGQFVKGGKIINNTIIGCDPTDPNKTNGDYAAANSFVADAIAAQGCWDMEIAHNTFLHCGSAGVSAGRVSGRLNIHHNYGRDLFEPVVNCGTAYTIIEVDDIAGFERYAVGNILATSTNTNATIDPSVTGQISFVDPFTNRIGFDSTFGIEWLVGQPLTQGAATAIITDTFISGLDMVVHKNTGLDVCQGDTNVGGINCIRCGGQTLITDNTILAPLELGTVKVLGSSAGTVGFTGNIPSQESDPAKYTRAGELSTWLFEDANIKGIHELLDGVGPELTISSGQIDVTHKYHKIDTENGDPLDRLTQINSIVNDGAEVNLSVKAGSRNVYLETGGFINVGNGRLEFPTTKEVLKLVKNNGIWVLPNVNINAYNGARLKRGRGADLIINTNSITITHEIHQVDTENSDPNDIINNIQGTFDEGAKLYLFINTSVRTVSFNNSPTLTVENSPYTLSVPNDVLSLTYINGKWRTASGVANLL